MARILLVEDDDDVRLLLEHVLTREGYVVTAMETSAQARGVLERERDRYDLVLADGKLNDGTGMDVGDRAEALGVPVLIVTGYGLTLDPAKLRRFDYLLKPVRPAELLEAIMWKLRAQPAG